MARMKSHPFALTSSDECFIGTEDMTQTGILDNYSATSSAQSDCEEEGDDGNFVNHSVPFPWKLHEMLEIAEKEEFTNIVSWLPDHQSFKVYQIEVFVRDVMPKYFRQTKYKSFQRQLNMWGFERLLSGPSKGGYLHQHFKRGQPALCRYMKRLKIKGTGNKKSVSSPLEPSSNTKTKNSTQLSPRHVISQEAVNSMYQNMPLNSFGSIQVETSARNTFFTTNPLQQVTGTTPTFREGVTTNINENPAHAPCNIDLFDEDTLASVLSTVLENPTGIENVPNDGDCVIFEGMQFFFVEDSQTTNTSRRLSIELNRGAGVVSQRRLSLVGAQRWLSTPMSSLDQPIFSLEESTHSQQLHVDSTQSSDVVKQRANRRFSLQRAGSSGPNAYVLKQILEI